MPPARPAARGAPGKNGAIVGSPLAIDLFCGLGGWAEGFLAEGYRVVGFDNDARFAGVYPGEFVLADVRSLDGRRFRGATVIVASPPCNPYVQLPWYDPPPPDGLWEEAVRIGMETGVPLIIENVRGAQRFHGRAVSHHGSRYLWGDVPLLAPHRIYGKWRLPPSPDRAALRAMIPLPLARAVARAFLPEIYPVG